MTYILLAHGSPDARHGDQVRQLAGKVATMLHEDVRVGFLNDEALPAGATVLPLFLGAGQHLRLDAPRLAAASGCRLLPPLAGYAEQLAAMAMDLAGDGRAGVHALFAVYRLAGFEELVTALQRQAGRCAQMTIAAMHGEPSIEAALQRWRDGGTTEITLQPMLLFAGHTFDRVRAAAGRVAGVQVFVGPPLAEHEAMPALIADCLRGDER